MLFGAGLVFEREPMYLRDLPFYLLSWVQTVGGFATFAAYLWLVVGYPRIRAIDRVGIPAWKSYAFTVFLTISALCYTSSLFAYSDNLLFAIGFKRHVLLSAAISGGSLALALTLLLACWMSSDLASSGSIFRLSPKSVLTIAGILSVACLVYAIMDGLEALAIMKQSANQSLKGDPTLYYSFVGLFTLAGIAGILAVLVPFVSNMAVMRWQRISAIARLSFKEAIRRRVLYAFALILVVFLFATWFVRTKSEDQVRTYVGLVSFAMAVLILFAAVIIASFSIPADIKQQTVHTILTKPVERFELVLGRFLGYVALMTLVQLVMTALSLLYVLREINPEAAKESLKARAPIYGELKFENIPGADNSRGENVGNEWEYRSYISFAEPGAKQKTAVWSFPLPPSSVTSRKEVPCEFTFSVYRTTKGKEYEGISCRFVFATSRFKEGALGEYQAKLDKKLLYRSMQSAQIKEDLANELELKNAPDKLAKRLEEELADRDRSIEDIRNSLCEQFGCYTATTSVTNGHTQSVSVPAGLFRNALADTSRAPEVAPISVRVTCESPTQYIGMARHDLYFRLDDPGKADRFWFAVNFFKGGFGLWLRLCLIIGLAVALSTYLSGVISLLIALLFFLGGENREFIQSVAYGMSPGGGPLESLVRVVGRQNTQVKLEESAAKNIVEYSDIVFRWIMRRVQDIVPDTQRMTLTPYVAEGFDIGLDQMFLSFLMLLGYLLPWGVLGFYLIKWREVASAT